MGLELTCVSYALLPQRTRQSSSPQLPSIRSHLSPFLSFFLSSFVPPALRLLESSSGWEMMLQSRRHHCQHQYHYIWCLHTEIRTYSSSIFLALSFFLKLMDGWMDGWSVLFGRTRLNPTADWFRGDCFRWTSSHTNKGAYHFMFLSFLTLIPPFSTQCPNHHPHLIYQTDKFREQPKLISAVLNKPAANTINIDTYYYYL